MWINSPRFNIAQPSNGNKTHSEIRRQKKKKKKKPLFILGSVYSTSTSGAEHFKTS